jgi:hypothetical protein
MFTRFDVASQHGWRMFIGPKVWSARLPMKQRLIRLDRIAGELNAWLLVIAIGLGMLDLTVLAAKCLPALPKPPAAAGADGPGPAIVQPQTPNSRS